MSHDEAVEHRSTASTWFAMAYDMIEASVSDDGLIELAGAGDPSRACGRYPISTPLPVVWADSTADDFADYRSFVRTMREAGDTRKKEAYHSDLISEAHRLAVATQAVTAALTKLNPPLSISGKAGQAAGSSTSAGTELAMPASTAAQGMPLDGGDSGTESDAESLLNSCSGAGMRLLPSQLGFSQIDNGETAASLRETGPLFLSEAPYTQALGHQTQHHLPQGSRAAAGGTSAATQQPPFDPDELCGDCAIEIGAVFGSTGRTQNGPSLQRHAVPQAVAMDVNAATRENTLAKLSSMAKVHKGSALAWQAQVALLVLSNAASPQVS
eukprot:TRINITY_DN714_c0_g2_i1.p1 TRINITY_DN714_c0_g2~~TRINITY_DN714_c0_g2_i1.p1  ORF type:complete len:339 (+),score=43.41 TRINITY_DN714_c0_g2_i1:38-1018(+)